MDAEPQAGELALSALLSQLLVAFVIEFDNEFEHRMPHRTTRHGRVEGPGPRPWLVSMAMWAHCMRLVPDDGIPVGELVRRSQVSAKGMQMLVKRLGEWWGYLTVTDAADGQAAKSRSSRLVRPTAAGRRANEIWAPLTAAIEGRWQARFGRDQLGQLRQALGAVVDGLDTELPDFLPVADDKLESRQAGTADRTPTAELPALLCKVLMALAVDFDGRSDLSLDIYTSGRTSRLAISANIMRVLSADGVRVADIPALTGVAKMTIDNWLGSLDKHGYLTITADPAAGRYRLAKLTDKGEKVRDAYLSWTEDVEQRWQHQVGAPLIRELRASSERLVIAPECRSLLYGGIEPYPDGWRHDIRPPLTLPHYPVITARGGFPDGS